MKCPDCGAPAEKKSPWAFCFTFLGTAGCAIWIPVLGWIIAVAAILMAIFFALGALTSKQDIWWCNNCKKQVKVTQ